MLRRDGQGFTLIELMVTIALLGIIAGVALPAFVNQNIRAKTAALVSAGTAAQVYVGNVYASTLSTANITQSYSSSTSTPDYLYVNSPQINTINIQNGVVAIYGNSQGLGQNAINLYFVPTTTNGRLEWSCRTECVNSNYVPNNCKYAIGSPLNSPTFTPC